MCVCVCASVYVSVWKQGEVFVTAVNPKHPQPLPYKNTLHVELQHNTSSSFKHATVEKKLFASAFYIMFGHEPYMKMFTHSSYCLSKVMFDI